MKYLKIYENFSTNQQFVESFGFDYDELLDSCISEFGSEEDGKYELDWYIDTLKDLYENGGEIYRIVKLPNENMLNKSKLGNHWVMDEGLFGRVYGNVEGEYVNQDDYDEDSEYHPFVITAHVNPKSINVKFSLGAFNELPIEGEIYVENGVPEFIKIEKYITL